MGMVQQAQEAGMTFRLMHGHAKTRRPAVNSCPGFRFALFVVVLGIATWAGCPPASGQEVRLAPVPQNSGAVPPSPVSGALPLQPELPPGSVSPVLPPAT